VVPTQAFNNPGGVKPLFFSSKASMMSLAAAPPPSSCSGGEVASLGTAKGMTTTAFSPSMAYSLSLTKLGNIAVAKVSSNATLALISPATSCSGPFSVLMQRSGNLVLRDKFLRSVWSSGNACASPSNASQKCYSYQVANNGQLVVQDQARNVVWRSHGNDAAASSIQYKTQLISNSTLELSCIWSGPGRDPALLASRGGRYVAAVDQRGGLQVVDLLSKMTTFSPAAAKPGSAEARLCIRNTGELELLGGGGGSLAWPGWACAAVLMG
jgi:hypothetical protein